jgi:hypothetical protein
LFSENLPYDVIVLLMFLCATDEPVWQGTCPDCRTMYRSRLICFLGAMM